MKTIDLSDLLRISLHELYNAENQLLDTFPDIIDEVISEDLQQLLFKNMKETNQQSKRLEKILSNIAEPAEERKCRIMHELLDRSLQLIKASENSKIRDAGIIFSVQAIAHFKIARFGTLAAYAKLTGYKEVFESFKNIIEEEKEFDKALTELAVKQINVTAKTAAIVSE